MPGRWRTSEKQWRKHHRGHDIVERIVFACEKCGRGWTEGTSRAVCSYGNCSYTTCPCGRIRAVGAAHDTDDRWQRWFDCRCGVFLGHQTYAEQRRPPVAIKRSRSG